MKFMFLEVSYWKFYAKYSGTPTVCFKFIFLDKTIGNCMYSNQSHAKKCQNILNTVTDKMEILVDH